MNLDGKNTHNFKLLTTGSAYKQDCTIHVKCHMATATIIAKKMMVAPSSSVQHI